MPFLTGAVRASVLEGKQRGEAHNLISHLHHHGPVKAKAPCLPLGGSRPALVGGRQSLRKESAGSRNESRGLGLALGLLLVLQGRGLNLALDLHLALQVVEL